jgi:hypothetical protein
MFLFFESGRFLVNRRRNFNNIRIHEKQSELFARGVVITNNTSTRKRKENKETKKKETTDIESFII